MPGVPRALFAQPMTQEQLRLYQRCTGRTLPPAEPFTEAAVVVGRRGGKSRTLAFVACALAVLRDYGPYLSAGELATIGVLAVSTKQARSIFNYVLGLLKAVPSLKPLIVDANADTILLSNSVQIEIAAASFRSTRGYTYAGILCDEIAFWRDETSANPDIEILRALRPGLASIPGSILMLASSPYAKKGALYNSYRRNFGKDDARVLVWKAPTVTMNPRIDKRIIEEAREEDPEACRAEYDAEFRDDLSDFVTRESIDAVTMWGRRELPPMAGVIYRAFCDPSGGGNDAMVLAIGHQEADVGVIDVILEIRPPFDPDVAVAQCAGAMHRYGVSRVVGDRYAGLWPVVRFAAHGITFDQSAVPKSDIYMNLLPLVNAKRIELLDNPRCSAQLAGLERRTARSGKDSVDHQPGGHDDIINAVAGLLVGLDLDRRPSLLKPDDFLEGGEGLPMPTICDVVYGVLAVGEDGRCGVVYAARSRFFGVPMLILDFDAVGMGGRLFAGIAARLAELGAGCRARCGTMLFVPEELVPSVRVPGLRVEALPRWGDELGELGLVVAGHAMTGEVKLSEVCVAKSRHEPFRGALSLRSGDLTDDPLRLAALLAVCVALEIERPRRRPSG
jgi:hypothetical protein